MQFAVWSTTSGVPVLARSTVQYFKQIKLAGGDLAVQNDRIVVLLAKDQDEEVQ
jgi:hypothetical protein